MMDGYHDYEVFVNCWLFSETHEYYYPRRTNFIWTFINIPGNIQLM